MKYAFFPGCTFETTAKETKTVTLNIAKALGIELVEMDGWTCCGTGRAQDVNEMAALSINARNLALAEKMDLPIITACDTCTLMLVSAKSRLDGNEEIMGQVNGILKDMGYQYAGTAKVKHLLWALVEDLGLDQLKKRVQKPLKGLKVASFYGSHLLRAAYLTGFENELNPHSLEDLLAALGADKIDYTNRLDCCGYHAVVAGEKEAQILAEQISQQACTAGADCIVTPCPLCQMQLNNYQSADVKIPVVHISELIGLALGFDPQELGLERYAAAASFLEKLR